MSEELYVQLTITLTPGASMPEPPSKLWPITTVRSGNSAVITVRISQAKSVEEWLRSVPDMLAVEKRMV